MAVQWGLANPTGGFDYLETLRTLGQQQALQQDIASQAQRQQIQGYAFNRQQEQDAARPQILQQAQGGDGQGAQQRAFAIGDYDALKAVQGMDEQKRGELAKQMGTLGRLATSLINVPADQRQQAYAAVAPMLIKQGFDPALVQSADLSDGGLQQYIAAAGSTDDVLKNYYKQQEGYTLNQGDRRYVGGAMVAENPAAPKYQSVPEGGMLVRTDGGTATPVLGMGGGDPVSRSGGASAGRYQYGWTPRARNGGDNSDAAVDSKIAGMTQALGIPADQPFPPGITPTQIAQALTLSEGGRGSLADRNNNPGNLRDPRTGDYRKFATKADGIAAAAAQVRRNLARGQNTIQAMVEGVPAGGGRQRQQAGGAPDVIYGRPKSASSQQAPSGYEWDGNGGLRPIRGGPADKGKTGTAALKPVPTKSLTDYQENITSIRQIDEVMALLDPRNNSPQARRAKGAIGPTTGLLGDRFTQFNDPQGTEARAMIGRIGGIIIKDTSGAAVSASEDARLSKWVPMPTDTPDAARTKLRNLRNAISNTQQAFGDVFNEDNGFKPLRARNDPSARQSPQPAQRQQPQRAAIGIGQSTQVGGFKVTRVK